MRLLCLVVVLAGSSAFAELPETLDSAFSEYLEKLKETCGAAPTVESDIENANPNDYQGGPASYKTRAMISACGGAVRSFSELCEMSEQWKPIIARELKTVRCSFSGHSPKKKGESPEVYIVRNLSFKDGVFTIHTAPGFQGTLDEASKVLRAGLRGKSGAPEVSDNLLKHGDNGETCSKDKDCRTLHCSHQVCAI